MAEKIFAAMSAVNDGSDFVQRKGGAAEELAAVFDHVETELDMVGTVAGQRVEADPDKGNPFGVLSSGFFLHEFDDGLDEVNFMHNKSIFFYWTAISLPHFAKG